jgi:two-component system sensor histidine kinase VicK
LRTMKNCAASVSVTAAEQIPCMIAFLDIDGLIRYSNSRLLGFSGYDSDELSGRSINLLYSEESDFKNSISQWTTLKPDNKWSGYVRCKKKDMTQFGSWIEVSRCSLAESPQAEFIAIFTDVTELASCEQRAKSERDRAQLCMDIAGVFILMLDSDNRVQFINRKGCKLLGMEREQILGLNWISNFLPERERVMAGDLFRKIFNGERDDSEYFQNVVLCEKGSTERVFIWHSSALTDAEGFLTSVLLSGEDITEMRETDLMKSDLMNIVSHEIRTPLASIRGFSELMLNRKLDQEKNHRYLLTISKEAERLSKFVDEFLDIQRIENSGNAIDQILKQEVIDIGRILNEVKVTFEPDKTHKLIISRNDKGAYVFADYDKILRLITNLVSNAYKYSPKAETVFLSCEVTGPNVRVTVVDKGLGVPEEAIPQLFSKFYRVDTLLHRKVTGTGLGLAICKSIVEAHQGRIWVESKVNEGSRFIFELPKV